MTAFTQKTISHYALVLSELGLATLLQHIIGFMKSYSNAPLSLTSQQLGSSLTKNSLDSPFVEIEWN